MDTILIVDDNPENLELLGYLLGRSGRHEVVTALGGQQGLARAQELHPDVVLVDLRMPGIDGWTLAHRIRADATLSDTRLLAVSVGAVESGVEGGADFDGFFSMPFEPADLIAAVDALLDGGPGR